MNKMRMVVGTVMIAVAIILFPIVLTGANSILANVNSQSFTGLDDIVAIAPTVVFVSLLFGGGYSLYSGAKGRR